MEVDSAYSNADAFPFSRDFSLMELDDQARYSTMLETFVRADPPGLRIHKQLVDIMRCNDEKAHYGVFIDSRNLLDCDMLLGHLILRYPSAVLKLFSDALVSQQTTVLETFSEQSFERGVMIPKRHIHARIKWLPGANRKPNISSLRTIDVNGFVQISGTVTRCSSIKLLEAIRVFECTNTTCDGKIKAFANKHEVGNIIEKPSGLCPSCKKSSSYVELKEEVTCYDYQELKVQEQVHNLDMGSIPRSISVVLLHDLVDKSKPGDDVVVTGVPIHRWSVTYEEERCNLETVIDANTVEVVNTSSQGVVLTEDVETGFWNFWEYYAKTPEQGGIGKPFAGRDTIVKNVCPQLYGAFVPKLAVALAMSGCSAFFDKTGSRVRGDLHLLLVGDPGTGKSQLLRFAAKLSPRAVLTAGTGATGVGLTCSVVREGRENVLEAGAMVLADRGVCCIDEFDSIQKNDRAKIHEAMEQQTLSIAKAGLVCSLQTRTTVLAACNTKGSFCRDSSLSTNTGIESPLLSRFDMALVLLDLSNEDWDRRVSEFVLCAQMGSCKPSFVKRRVDKPDIEEKTFENDENGECVRKPAYSIDVPVVASSSFWTMDALRSYFAFVKRFDPQLTPEAGAILSAYYKAQRMRDDFDAGRTTIRLLESLIRIAKAHARLMARKYVFIVDAVVAVKFVEASMSYMFDGMQESAHILRSDFEDSPDEEMRDTTQRVLRELKLTHLCEQADEQLRTGLAPSVSEPSDDCRSNSDISESDLEIDRKENSSDSEDQSKKSLPEALKAPDRQNRPNRRSLGPLNFLPASQANQVANRSRARHVIQSQFPRSQETSDSEDELVF